MCQTHNIALRHATLAHWTLGKRSYTQRLDSTDRRSDSGPDKVIKGIHMGANKFSVGFMHLFALHQSPAEAVSSHVEMWRRRRRDAATPQIQDTYSASCSHNGLMRFGLFILGGCTAFACHSLSGAHGETQTSSPKSRCGWPPKSHACTPGSPACSRHDESNRIVAPFIKHRGNHRNLRDGM